MVNWKKSEQGHLVVLFMRGQLESLHAVYIILQVPSQNSEPQRSLVWSLLTQYVTNYTNAWKVK